MDGPVTFDLAPVISLVGHIVTAVCVVVVLGMLKGIIAHGVSIGIAEYLVKCKVTEQNKMVRWFSNDDEITEILTEIRDRTKPKRSRAST